MLKSILIAVVAISGCWASSLRAPEHHLPSSVDLTLSERFQELVEQVSTEVLHLAQKTGSHELNSADNEGDGSCCECVGGVSHHIMSSVIEMVKKECKKTKCPVMKKHCEMMEKYPEESLGGMIYHVHPFEKSYAYCYGRGVCPHPGQNNKARDELMVHQCANNARLPQDQAQIIQVALLQDVSKKIANKNRAAPVDIDFNQLSCSQNDMSECSCCIHGVGAQVFGNIIHHLEEMCKETECPFIKRKCKFAEDHKKIVEGFLWEHIRPMEWSCGFCNGAGKCNKNDETFFDSLDMLV